MPQLPSLRVGLTLDSATFIRETNKVIDAVNRTGREMQRQNAITARSFEGINTGISSVSRNLSGLRNLIGIGSFGALGREVIQTADSMTLLSARISLFTTSAEEAARVQDRLVQISTQTRVSLKDTGDLYSRLALTLTDAGVSTQQLLAVTDLVNKSLAVLGGSTPSTSAGMIQFSQAMGSGVLRGQELASVMEQIPSLAKNIADGLGVSIAELRKMGKEGELTTDRVLNALLKQAPKINEQFRTLPVTVGQSITQLGTAFSVLIGESNDATSATATLATTLSDLATFISSPGFVQSFNTAATDLIANTRREMYLLGEAASWTKGQMAGISGFFTDRMQDMGLVSRSLADVTGKIRDLENEIDMLARNAQEQGQAPEDNWAIASRRRRLDALYKERDALAEQGVAAETAGFAWAGLARSAQDANENTVPLIEIFQGVGDSAGTAAGKVKDFTETLTFDVEGDRRLRQLNSIHANEKRIAAERELTIRNASAPAEALRDTESLTAEMEGVWQGLGQSIQNTFADTYEDIFTGGLTSFQDFASAIKDIFIRLAAEVAALMTSKALFGQLSGANFGGLFGAGGGQAFGQGTMTPGGVMIPALGPPTGGGIGQGYMTPGGQFIPAVAPAGGFGQSVMTFGQGSAFGSMAGGPGGFMGAPSGASGAGIATAGGLGATAGMFIGPAAFGNKPSTQYGAAIGGGIGAAAGTAMGGPIGGMVGGIGGSLVGGFIGSQFGGKGQDNKVMMQGMLGAGAGGTGAAAQFVQGIDNQLKGLLTAAQETAADVYLKRAAAVAVQYDKQMSAADMARLAAGRFGPVAESLGFNAAAVTRGSAEQQQVQFQEALTAKNAIDDLRGSLSPFAQQWDDLGDQFAELGSIAVKYGISLDGVAEAQARANAELARQQRLTQNSVAALVGAMNPLDRALSDLQTQMEQASAEAQALGVYTGNLAQIQAAAAQEIVRAYRLQHHSAAEAVGAITPFQRAMGDLQVQMEAAWFEANRLGISTANLGKIQAAAIQEISRANRLQYHSAAEAVEAITPLERALGDLQVKTEAAWFEANRLGISTDRLAQSQMAAAIAIQRQHQAQMDAMALSITNPFEQLMAPLKALGIELNRSLMDPLEQFNASAQNFRDVARAAMGGSTTAIAQLDEAAKGFIDTATTVNASAGRAAATREVQSVLQQVMGHVQFGQTQASRGVEGAIWGANQRVVDTLGELVTVGHQQIEEMRRLQRQLS